MEFTPMHLHRIAGIAALSLLSTRAAAQDTLLFFSDFESGFPIELTTVASPEITGVQGYSGLGRDGYRFGGQFFRSPTGSTVTLTLSNLPPHTTLALDFLFAAIDSLDGTGSFPSGDFFKVMLDGVQVFRESFANASPGQIQSYVSAPGVELARHVNLGFSGPGSYYTDSAYDMSLEPSFHGLSHSASTAVFTFQIEGPGIQSLADESWAFDNLRVRTDAPVSYCTAKVNSLGCTPRIGSLDVASVSAGNFAVTAYSVLNQKSGLMFWGVAAGSAPFHGGTLCVAAPTIRTPVVSSGGTALPASDCSGSYRFDFTSAYIASRGLVPGSTIFCQWWARDPNAVAFDSLSNGLSVTFGQ